MEFMAYDEEEDLELDEELEEDEETLRELEVDENGHVSEGKRRRNRDDEYEPDFDDVEHNPAMYGYSEEESDD